MAELQELPNLAAEVVGEQEVLQIWPSSKNSQAGAEIAWHCLVTVRLSWSWLALRVASDRAGIYGSLA